MSPRRRAAREWRARGIREGREGGAEAIGHHLWYTYRLINLVVYYSGDLSLSSHGESELSNSA
jgi:hypothetical protein